MTTSEEEKVLSPEEIEARTAEKLKADEQEHQKVRGKLDEENAKREKEEKEKAKREAEAKEKKPSAASHATHATADKPR